MLVYYIVIFFTFVFCSLAEKYDYTPEDAISVHSYKHTTNTKVLFFLATLLLILVAGLRYGVGADYWGYYNGGLRYEQSFTESLRTFDEPGIRLFYVIIRKFTTDGIVPIFVFSLFTIGLSMRMIFKYTDKLMMTTMLFIFLGCWYGSFNAVRQCLAATILFCGLPYLKEKKLIKYIIIVIIAFLFHRSAIVMIVPYFFLHIKISLRNAFLLVLGTIAVLYSYDIVFNFTESIMDSTYSANNEYIWRSVSFLRVLVAVLPSVFYLYIYRGKELDDDTTFLINICLVHAAVMIMASKSTYLARVSIYTSPFLAIAIPKLNKGITTNYRSLINFLMLFAYGGYFIYDIAHSDVLNNFLWVWNR